MGHVDCVNLCMVGTSDCDGMLIHTVHKECVVDGELKLREK